MKKSISFILALVMMATVLPFSAFAGDEYEIVCNDCYATLDFEDEITSAEEGATVYVRPAINENEYWCGFTAEETDVVIDGDSDSFTMPAHSVTLYAVVSEKYDFEFDLTSGECAVTPVMAASLPDIVGSVEPYAQSNDIGFDLDNDGISDVDYSETAGKLYVTAKAKETGIKTASRNVTSPYSPIAKLTFKFKDSSSQTVTHTVIWQYDDGREIAKAENVTDGTTVHFADYTTATPVKAGTDEYVYVFKGWTPEEGAVTADTTYTAVFEQKVRTRTVTWKNWNGKVLKTVTIPVTETPVYDLAKPTKKSDGKYKYTFAKWNAVVDKTTGDTVYTAEFKQTAIPIKLTASNKTFKQKAKAKKYTVTLKIDGKVAINKKITVKVNSKTYTAKTNKKGQATFNFTKLTKKGTYKATVKYSGNPKKVSKTVKIVIK